MKVLRIRNIFFVNFVHFVNFVQLILFILPIWSSRSDGDKKTYVKTYKKGKIYIWINFYKYIYID